MCVDSADVIYSLFFGSAVLTNDLPAASGTQQIMHAAQAHHERLLRSWRVSGCLLRSLRPASFLLRSRLNKDVLQSSGPLLVVSCHMWNTTFEHGSWCSYENAKDHLDILEILWAFSFVQVGVKDCKAADKHLQNRFTSLTGGYSLEYRSGAVVY